ncbi:hypothetical protein F7725_014050 [Dissostichus mawsoni]|uniref:Uncharacterized protein n=1 Tax=Dissostichus mawsoni TaxID=36200 RepID=A0A7J5YUV5_DISMA|nr:hypothetical protein F7725_014050 [Dissostichus mawsoni]
MSTPQMSKCSITRCRRTPVWLFMLMEDNTHMFFILSCAAILLATFSFIAVVACRPRHQNRTQIATSSNAMFLKNDDSEGHSRIFFNFNAQRGEKEPLLLQFGAPYSS